MNIKFKFSVLPLILLGIIFSSCQSEQRNAAGKPLVVSTTTLLDDMARYLGDTLFSYESLMGPGVDPHIYKPSQGDLKKLKAADLVIYNGLYLEGKMADVLQKMGRNQLVLGVADSIKTQYLIKNAEFEDGYDPHFWFDKDIWYMVAIQVSEMLKELEPEEAYNIEKRLEQFAIQLHLLDVEISEAILKIPEEKRVIVTSHDALNYFARRYGFEVRSLQGSSTASELGLKDVTEMVDFLVENQIKAIFPENITGDQSLQAVIKGAAKKGHTVLLGEELFSDALGGPDSEAPDYFSMLRENTRRIVSALQ
jgi:manganese/zinc/iron transport system substrate-binding protein